MNLPADELVALARLGQRFREQQRGARPGFLSVYLRGIVAKLERPTFAAVLRELEFAAAQRDVLGAKASPIERVSRDWELVTYHDPRRGRREVTFKTVKNKLHLRNPGCR